MCVCQTVYICPPFLWSQTWDYVTSREKSKCRDIYLCTFSCLSWPDEYVHSFSREIFFLHLRPFALLTSRQIQHAWSMYVCKLLSISLLFETVHTVKYAHKTFYCTFYLQNIIDKVNLLCYILFSNILFLRLCYLNYFFHSERYEEVTNWKTASILSLPLYVCLTQPSTSIVIRRKSYQLAKYVRTFVRLCAAPNRNMHVFVREEKEK